MLAKSETWLHLLLLEEAVLARVEKQLSRELQGDRKPTGDRQEGASSGQIGSLSPLLLHHLLAKSCMEPFGKKVWFVEFLFQDSKLQVAGKP